MIRRARAVWRLTRSTVHVGHGLLICAFEFPRATPEAKLKRIAWWNARMLRLMGLGLNVSGRPSVGPTLVAANHVSWIDIMSVNAVHTSRFVSKSDVRAWPLLGWLVASGGTLFIDRTRRRDAHRVVHQIAEALAAGDRIAVFPEGTTGDGQTLLPFHGNLLQAAISTGTPVQPVAIRYSDATGPRSASTVWLGDTTLAGSMWKIACAEGLTANVSLLEPVATAGADRRELAARLQALIGEALSPPLPRGGEGRGEGWGE